METTGRVARMARAGSALCIGMALTATTMGAQFAFAAENGSEGGAARVYRYEALTADDTPYSVYDTVTFGEDGNCLTTEMQLTFSDEAALQAYLGDLEHDYGERYALLAQEASTATVKVDVSNLRFDEREYADALLYSVDNLAMIDPVSGEATPVTAATLAADAADADERADADAAGWAGSAAAQLMRSVVARG